MDFDNVLSIATQNRGLSVVPKRYSLKTGPPKKDERVKGVNSAAVQAFLKKQAMDQRKKEIQNKKAKEELLAKRVELKSDRKARAMASRTKDNFRGYNGIPVIDQPKKRQSKGGDRSEEQDRSNTYDDDDDDVDNYDYEGTDSESEEHEQSRPIKPPPQSRAEFSNKADSKPKKASAPPRSAPPSMNFAELLKLAQKKQYEPVEIKVVKKTEERLRTAEEIRELEMERRVKSQNKGKDAKPDKNPGQKDIRSQSSSNSQKKNVDRDGKNGKLPKPPVEKYQSSSASKKPKLQASSERTPASAKLHGDRNNSGSSGVLNGKSAMKHGAPFTSKQAPPRPPQGQRPTTSSDLTPRKGNTSVSQGKSSISGSRPVATPGGARSGQGPHKNSGQGRPSNSDRGGQPQKPAKPVHLSRPGSVAPPRPGSNGLVRPSSGEPSKQPRPGGSFQGQQVPGSSRAFTNGPSRMGGSVSGRPVNGMGMGSGPGRPQCTVVSETISSKNFALRPGMASGPQGPRTVIAPSGHRVLVKPPGPSLPPITSAYKRKYEEEEEYDSEMDDFIDDEGEDQDEVSKHIREIFGYDRSKYKDESDYALKFMESSWRDQQKEEARSLRMAVLEDQEEERRELEEMNLKNAKKRK
ncbi:protein SPT2 homolog isoform X2 [Pimephales promelas]|uniref:protein SPT2 homolog isoform X2 n=1 Tax=Pimephales promelas TaxID=90988 RepID=UPI001955BF85|nr:protein SPT2 homolog isoform X2 [Pimephales promelas]KAG1931183.1 protein SPT2 [Pimephales promelas]